MNPTVTIIVAVFSSSAFCTLVQYLVEKRHQKSDSGNLLRDTLAALAYSSLSNEIERLLTKDFATPDERRTLRVLDSVYKRNGWNGDMKARMDKVYKLSTDKCHIHSEDGRE